MVFPLVPGHRRRTKRIVRSTGHLANRTAGSDRGVSSRVLLASATWMLGRTNPGRAGYRLATEIARRSHFSTL